MKKIVFIIFASILGITANAQVANIDSATAIIHRLVNSKFSASTIETEVNRLHKDADQNSMSILY